MSSFEPDLWGWAKTNRRGPSEPGFEWLSYLDHGLDVAAAFRALAEGPYRGLIQGLFKRVDDELLDTLTAFIGMHDLAKASWTFQGMASGPTPLSKPFGYIHHAEEACAWLYPAHQNAMPTLSAALQPLANLADGDDRALLRAVFSHHGLPRNGQTWQYQTDLPGRILAHPASGGSRDPIALVSQLVQSLPTRGRGSPLAALSKEQRHTALHGLMGIVNLADWIGSSTAWFPLRPARQNGFDRWWAARRALAEIGWPILCHANDEDAIRDVLALYTGGKARTLRPVQARVVAAIIANPPVPGDVLVLEEETGGGKTLIAYLVHALLARRGLCTGLTFCLPTRASARAIHAGAMQVYGERINPVLAVGGYDKDLILPHLGIGGPGQRGHTGLGWAARSRHRFLVAPVSVGTVDQVLLGALTVKFAHLRQIAPACNLLVVDEVHASDLYMRDLLHEVVQRRRTMGGITLLMSATLGADLRNTFLTQAEVSPQQRRRSRDSSLPMPQAAGRDGALAGEDAPYPALWNASGIPVKLADGLQAAKTVKVAPCVDWPEQAVENIAMRAVSAARAGARVLIIRNTVRLARATASAIAILEPGLMLHLGSHPVCHHARFAAQDRLALDQAFMTALDPRVDSRGNGVIAVTTQTAEQSLDVDADLLITDLTPIDVLLQRIGRLHRNRSIEATAARPSGFTEACCVVLAPADPADLLRFAVSPGHGPNGWGTDRAYADTLALAATREMIGASALWHIPDDNRRLVEGVMSKQARASCARKFGNTGRSAEYHVLALAMFQKEQQREVSWSFRQDPSLDRLCEGGRFETGAEGMAATRLGLSDVRIEMVQPFPSPFGSWSIESVTVPGWLALALQLPGDGQATWKQSGNEVELLVEGHAARFSYGPFGLAPLQTGRPT